MPSSHLILCHPLLLLPSIFPSIRVFSNESTLCIRWPKYWSFSLSISPSNEHPGLITFNELVGSPCNPRDSQEYSPTPQFKSINSSVLSFLHSPTLTSIELVISSSIVAFSSCPQSFPASVSFQMSQLFASGGQSIGVSALASFLPKKSQG